MIVVPAGLLLAKQSTFLCFYSNLCFLLQPSCQKIQRLHHTAPVDLLTLLQCTEGWDCDLGFQGLKFFFGNNGLGGFLGPHWKVFHPGTLSGHFQGVVIAFGSRPGGEKRVKMG